MRKYSLSERPDENALIFDLRANGRDERSPIQFVGICSMPGTGLGPWGHRNVPEQPQDFTGSSFCQDHNSSFTLISTLYEISILFFFLLKIFPRLVSFFISHTHHLGPSSDHPPGLASAVPPLSSGPPTPPSPVSVR